MTHPPGSDEERVEIAVRETPGTGKRFVLASVVLSILAGLVAAAVSWQVSMANTARMGAETQTQSLADAVKVACGKDVSAAEAQGFPCATASSIAGAVSSYLKTYPPAPGKDGIGVTSTRVTGCELFVTLTDGRVIDAGSVCAPTTR